MLRVFVITSPCKIIMLGEILYLTNEKNLLAQDYEKQIMSRYINSYKAKLK